MARKELTRIAKLEFMAGQAKPGPALAGLGIDMVGFTKEYNKVTKEFVGNIIPVEIKCYSDRSYELILKTTPASKLILKAAKLEKGAANALTDAIGKITKTQAQEIAEYKMKDLNANNIEQAMKIIVGTAHNMGIEVEGYKKVVKEDLEKMIINVNYEQQIADMEAGIAEANATAASKTEAEEVTTDDVKETDEVEGDKE